MMDIQSAGEQHEILEVHGLDRLRSRRPTRKVLLHSGLRAVANHQNSIIRGRALSPGGCQKELFIVGSIKVHPRVLSCLDGARNLRDDAHRHNHLFGASLNPVLSSWL